MENFGVLDALLATSIILGLSLAFISQASLGRSLGDIERQRARNISGGPPIQAWQNARMHVNRVLFGTVFVIINIMLVAGAPELWRMWVFRLLWNSLLLVVVTSAILDWIAERRLIKISVDRQLGIIAGREVLAKEAEARREADLDMDKESYRQITEQAVSDLERVVKESGVVVPEPLVPVLSEHGSPVTPQQKSTAEIQTLRARLVAARLALGLPTEDVKNKP